MAFAVIFAMSSTAFSQFNLGGRASASLLSGVELSAQYAFSESNRLEGDLGLAAGVDLASGYNYMNTALSVIFHWTFDIANGFAWYVGPGAQVGSSTWRTAEKPDSGVWVAACAQGGVEYNFSFPLQLSVDFRPTVNLLHPLHHPDPHLLNVDFGISARYRF